MNTDTDDLILDRLSDDFRRRLRAGEAPDIDEYAANHPHLAERIRNALPGVVALEGSRVADHVG